MGSAVQPGGCGPLRARLTWRRLHNSDLDHERIWAGVFFLGLGLALAVPEAWRLSFACPFKRVVGLPCLSCGSNRALSALLHAEPLRALSSNPLITLAVLSWGAFVIYAGVVVVGRLPRLRPVGDWRRHRRVLAALVGLGVVGNWAYLVTAGV